MTTRLPAGNVTAGPRGQDVLAVPGGPGGEPRGVRDLREPGPGQGGLAEARPALAARRWRPRPAAASAGGTRKRMAWWTSGLFGEELARDDERVLRHVRDRPGCSGSRRCRRSAACGRVGAGLHADRGHLGAEAAGAGAGADHDRWPLPRPPEFPLRPDESPVPSCGEPIRGGRPTSVGLPIVGGRGPGTGPYASPGDREGDGERERPGAVGRGHGEPPGPGRQDHDLAVVAGAHGQLPERRGAPPSGAAP